MVDTQKEEKKLDIEAARDKKVNKNFYFPFCRGVVSGISLFKIVYTGQNFVMGLKICKNGYTHCYVYPI